MSALHKSIIINFVEEFEGTHTLTLYMHECKYIWYYIFKVNIIEKNKEWSCLKWAISSVNAAYLRQANKVGNNIN